MYKRKIYKSSFTSMKENEIIINLLFKKPNDDNRKSEEKDKRSDDAIRQSQGSAD